LFRQPDPRPAATARHWVIRWLRRMSRFSWLTGR